MEESIKIEEAIAKALKLEAVDPRTYSPLVLAYIGDAVYELLIRTKVINHGSMQVNKMHKKSASLVKAETCLLYTSYPDRTKFKTGRPCGEKISGHRL